jgi:cytochrome P450
MDRAPREGVGALPTPPGPTSPTPLLLLQWVRRPAQFLERNRRRYGPIFAARLGPKQNVVFLSDLEAIQAAIANDGRDVRMGEANRFFRHVLGPSSILALDGEEHLRHRRLMAPGFRRSHVRKWTRLIEDSALARLESLPRDVPVRLQPEFERVAFDAAMGVVFGIEEGERSNRIRELFPQVMDQTERPIHLLPWFRRELGGRSPWGHLMGLVAELDGLLRAEIRERRRDPLVEARDDLLSLLCHAEQGDGTPMTETELRDEMLTLLIAGQETTSAAMAWTFERLAHAPRVADRLARELRGGAEGGEYLDAVVRESLRLRPPVPVLARKAKVPLQLGEYVVPPGWVVMPSPYLLHREESLYPRPDEFLPERFLVSPPPRGAWLPFGGGVRHCMGTHLAELEIRIVLREFLSRVKLEPAGRAERVRRRRFAFSPAGEARVVLSDRPRRLNRVELRAPEGVPEPL